jgi:hypothetical protein
MFMDKIMDKKVKGSWLIHHTNKLQTVTNQSGFENTFLSGKSGIFLSAISANNELTIDNEKLSVLANAANINVAFELPTIIKVLRERQLIDIKKNGIAVLGLTTSSALQHTSDIFDSLKPNAKENAAIYIAERASLKPISSSEALAETADIYKIDRATVAQIILDSEQIGFVDVEDIGSNDKILFNGNLFRREHTQKIKCVLDSLLPTEQRKLTEANELIQKSVCAPVQTIKKILGDILFDKVIAIGLFDINVVSNSIGEVGFMSLPSAFSKFSNSMVDDAFDLAKAFVSSITYGMTKSAYARGKIQMVDCLLRSLINGESVGPVNAIAEDYKVLELKGVVQVKNGSKKGRTGPMLKLLKKEVGELALQAIQQGDVSEHSLESLPSAAITKFSGPEYTREKVRRKQKEFSPKATNDMLSVLRTGGSF